jgi:hypothetical protein
MDKGVMKQIFKASFFILSVAILTAFSIVTLIEGMLTQVVLFDSLTSLVYYFVSMCAIGSAMWTYFKARKTLSTIY